MAYTLSGRLGPDWHPVYSGSYSLVWALPWKEPGCTPEGSSRGSAGSPRIPTRASRRLHCRRGSSIEGSSVLGDYSRRRSGVHSPFSSHLMNPAKHDRRDAEANPGLPRSRGGSPG